MPDKESEETIRQWYEEGTGHSEDVDGDGERFLSRERSEVKKVWFVDVESVDDLFLIAKYFGPLILKDSDYMEAPLRITLQNW